MSGAEPIIDRRAEFPKFSAREAPPSFPGFVDATRDLLDLAVAADAPEEAYARAQSLIAEAVAALGPYRERTEGDGPGHRVPALPGRGNANQVPWRMEKFDATGVRSTVRFRRAHVGGHGAAHGGMIGLLFDEHLGWIVYSGGLPVARTAYLKIDYRAVAPSERDLVLDGWIERVEGRKIFVRATLSLPDGALLAECEALMIALLPHNA